VTEISRRQLMVRGLQAGAGLAVLGGATSLISAFGGEATASTPAGTGKLTKLTLQSSWVNDAEFLGYYTAIAKGYYRDAGLDVTYLPGGPDVVPESQLLGGKADIALTTPDTTTKAIADEKAPFVIIGAQFQKSPLGVVSLEKNHITKVQDLVGKKLAVPDVNLVSVKAMLKVNDIDESKVTIVPYEFDPTPLLKGEVDATIDFVTDVPYTIQQKGKKATSFLLADAGFLIYNDTVVVTEDTLSEKKAALKKFLAASRKGWATALADPGATVNSFSKSYFKGTGRTAAADTFLATAEKPLMDSPSGYYAMTADGIAGNVKALNEAGIAAKANMFDTSLLPAS
jgi:ABC-type nitrate/sulfonate/bicarbonate transport system substrate-binding protein